MVLVSKKYVVPVNFQKNIVTNYVSTKPSC